MKIGQFKNEETAFYAVVEGDFVLACDDQLQLLGPRFRLEDVTPLPPVDPIKIVCVGRNYAEHAKELGNEVPTAPLLFLKAPSAVIASGDSIVIPPQSSQVEHEGELAVVIGMDCKNIGDDEDPFEYVLGYTCLNDVTARDVQRADVQFTRGKSFDTFCPIGPYIETELDVSDIRVTTKVNGIVKQDGRTSHMVFPVDFLIRYISRQMTLNAGDVIATGTPSGVSKMVSG
ncbi:MAG TPA: fumarylacetoacetate hydrolase family protein, partial [Pyrinomonadaceae bacterium]|nr:fumarylacetoacetate hydrolase family protein [Pyrinomonadaceae bacterium]